MSFFRKKPVIIFILAVALLLAVAMGVLFYFTYSELDSVRDEFVKYKNSEELSGDSEGDGISAENRRLERLLENAESAREELESRINELEKTVSGKSEEDSEYKELSDEIASLKEELETKNAEIESLKKDIRMAGTAGTTDMNAQYNIISAINEKITSAPKNVNDKSVVTDHGVPVTDENGNVVYETVETDPNIALYYYDLTRGYTYSYNADGLFNSSGLEKLILAYQLVSARATEEIQNADKSAEEQTDVYNFDTVYTYTSADYTAGFGSINKSDEGTEYKHSELISAMLKDCDSVAYKALTDFYGVKNMRSTATGFGMTVKNGEIYVSAKSMSKLLESVYDFAESGDEYSDTVKTAMKDSVHSILSGYFLKSGEIAHMSAWDENSYSDCVIVYGEHPYIIVVLTDMTSGGDEVNEFIGSLVSLIEELHLNFGG